MLTGIIKVLNACVNRVAEWQAFKNNFPYKIKTKNISKASTRKKKNFFDGFYTLFYE